MFDNYKTCTIDVRSVCHEMVTSWKLVAAGGGPVVVCSRSSKHWMRMIRSSRKGMEQQWHRARELSFPFNCSIVITMGKVMPIMQVMPIMKNVFLKTGNVEVQSRRGYSSLSLRHVVFGCSKCRKGLWRVTPTVCPSHVLNHWTSRNSDIWLAILDKKKK